MWWAPWTNWAGRMTTWAHLHFEVYKNKQLIDPLYFLNLAYLPNKTLDARYISKLSKDYHNRFWRKADLSKVQKFYIDWENEIQRQKKLLQKYAVPVFQDWKLWTLAWLDNKIDPSFLICIWLAESTLWRHLKTPYNIWNVWNTDSWAVRSFKNPRQWINAMARVLNNRYLWRYKSVDQLSWWGNKTWPIYASSPANWHNNIMKCLASLKWRKVRNDYRFRISN